MQRFDSNGDEPTKKTEDVVAEANATQVRRVIDVRDERVNDVEATV